MASKRPANVIPPSSESESEEETSSEEEAPTLKATSSAIVNKKPTSNKSESSSQSGSEDEPKTESESEPDEENVKLMASKPVQEGTGKGKKQEKLKSMSVSRPSKPVASIGVKSRGRRVASENEDGMDYKKSTKKSKGGEGDALEEEPMKTASESKKPFQRVWNEDEEIALLKGMVDFSSEEGADPCADMVAFHEFIKKLLHFDVSRVQLSDKIHLLKKKFENHSGRLKNGKNPTFSKPHEERAFELSNKVWGGSGVSEKVVADNLKSKKEKLDSSKSSAFSTPNSDTK